MTTRQQKNRAAARAQLYRVRKMVAEGKKIRLRKAYSLTLSWLMQNGIKATILDKPTKRLNKKQRLEEEFDKRLADNEHNILIEHLKRTNSYVRRNPKDS